MRRPLTPMLARLARELPRDGYVYEPKWDGFRCLVFRDGDGVDLRSRNQRPLARYFPELVEALLDLPVARFVIDGEIIVAGSAGSDFEALLRRLHPAASRVERLSEETPASLVAFDLVETDGADLRERPFVERRRLLVKLLEGAKPPIFLTPATDDAAVASAWLDDYEGVVAKHRDLHYEPGTRAMVKVKREHTVDCVVAGFRWFVGRPLPSSLLLGLYDDNRALQHVGIASSFTAARRRELLNELRPHLTDLAGHPWEHGFQLRRSPTGKLPGAAGRWSPNEMALDWTPVAPVLVCEVVYDQVDAFRFRHPARFRRWRPDLDPSECKLDRLEAARAPLAELLPL